MSENLIQSATARIIEAIKGCRKRRTVDKQRAELNTLGLNLGKIISSVKIKCAGDITIIDAIAINVHDWLQSYEYDKEIKSNIVRLLVMIFNS